MIGSFFVKKLKQNKFRYTRRQVKEAESKKNTEPTTVSNNKTIQEYHPKQQYHELPSDNIRHRSCRGYVWT